jgi:DNA-binding NarL/FixJ family response regulator
VSVVLIDQDRLLLESLPGNRAALEGIAFVGRALTIEGGIELIQRTAPDVVVADGLCFRIGFRNLTGQLSIRLGQSRLAVFADHLTDSQLELAISGGAIGLLSRQDSLTELAAALREIAQGRFYVSPATQGRVIPDPHTGNWNVRQRSYVAQLSDRQIEVLVHLAEGRRVKDIADSMHLSEKAIESHKYRLMNRLGIHDRVALCRWAIREGLISA